MYSTGIKVSELITISMEEIVYSIQSRDHTLIVCNSSRKERVVILNESAVLAVKNYLKVRNIFIHKMFYKKNFYKEKWLFHSLNKKGVVTHISRQRVGQILKKLATHNGISANIISPNRLRDSFAGHMLHNGADIRTLQELLGHTHMSSTKIYKKVVNQ